MPQGYYTDLVGGFQERQRELEKQNYDRSVAATEQEQALFSSLLSSSDPKIQALAMTGLLDSADPKRRKKGLAGWLGELEQSPHLAAMKALINTPITEQRQINLPGEPSRGISGPGAGGLPTVKPTIQQTPGANPAAMPATSLVDQKVNQPPPTPQTYTQQPPIPYTVSRPRQVFPTPEQKYKQQAIGKAQGDVEGEYAGLIAAGNSPEEARALIKSSYARRASGAMAPRYGGTMKGDQIAPSEQDAYGRPIDPNQHYRVQIQPDSTMSYLPTVAPGVGSAGVEYNRAAIQMGFRNASEVPAARRAELESTAERLTNELRYAGGIGTGNAQIETEGKKLLSPDEAAQLQSRYGITRDQAATLGRIPLTGPQVQAATESYLLDKDVASAKALFAKVWPQVAQPEQRRMALMALARSQNPDFIQLMSILKRMPLRLAVMTQGSRPSDTDKEVFDAAFPSTAADDWSLVTVPTSYETGLQLLTTAESLAKTSRESIGIIPLAERQQGAAATPPPVRPAVAAPGGGAASPGPEWQMINGVLHHNGQPY